MPELQSRPWWEQVFDVLTTGERASAALASGVLWGEDPAEAWRKHTDYQDIVDRLFPDAPEIVRRVIGLGSGIAFDPLTYLGVGALVKGGKGARALLTFGGRSILPEEISQAGMKGISGLRKGFLETRTGEFLGKAFVPEYRTKYLFPELKGAKAEYYAERGRFLRESDEAAEHLSNQIAQAGIDDETKLAILDYLEGLPRHTQEQFDQAINQVRDAINDPEVAEIFKTAGIIKRLHEKEWLDMGALTEKRMMGLFEKAGVAAHMRHYLKETPRNPIAYFRKRKLLDKFKRELRERGMEDVIPALDEVGYAVAEIAPKIPKGGSIFRKVYPESISKSRKIPGKTTAINKEIAERTGIKEFFETDLAINLGKSGREVAEAKAAKNYLKKMRDAVGVKIDGGEIPAGFMTLNSKQDPLKIFAGHAIPQDLEREVMQATRARLMADDVTEGILGMLDWGTDWFRTTTLHMFFGYHFRNILGDYWNSAVAGVWRYRDYKDGAKLVRRINLGTVGDDEVLAGLTSRQLFEEMSTGRVLDTGMLTGEVVQRTPKTLRQAVVDGNWVPLSRNFVQTRMGLWVGSYINNATRAAHYIARRRAGWSPTDAAMSVKKSLFDYTREGLTEFENEWLRRVFPFYRWTRNNVPYQLTMMLQAPGKYAGLQKFKNAVERYFGPQPVEKWMSEWMKENDPVHVGYDTETGQARYFFFRNWIPADDLLMLSDPINDLISMVNPWMKEPMQQVINWDFYFKNSITEIPGDFNPFGGHVSNFLGTLLNRRLIHLLKNVRLMNELDRLNPFQLFGKDRPHHLDPDAYSRWTRYFTGLRIHAYDPQKSKLYWEYEFRNRVSQLKGLIGRSARRGYVEEAAHYQQELQRYMEQAKAPEFDYIGEEIPAF